MIDRKHDDEFSSPHFLAYIQDLLNVFAKDITFEKFAQGQSNPTYKFTADGKSYVLRRKPAGQLLKSAHAVDREFRVQTALKNTVVPVPNMIHLCEDDSILGSMFYIMDHVDGVNFNNPCLPDRGASERRTIFDAMNETLAALRNVDIADIGLSDYGPDGDYFARQLSRWTRQYEASATGVIADMDQLIRKLTDQLPEHDALRCLVHGDFRLDNLIFDKNTLQCAAVLDWELSTLGHPYADLGAVIMQWGMPQGDITRGLAGVDRNSLGIPTDEEFVTDYFQRCGQYPPDNFHYYIAFAYFRMAAILQGVKKRSLDGNASNPEWGLKMGELVPVYAKNGLSAFRT